MFINPFKARKINFFYVLSVAIALFLIPVSFYVLLSAYDNIKAQAIIQLNEQQKILAKAASKGIETYFSTKLDLLQTISKLDDVINFNEKGKEILRTFFKSYPNEYFSITRMDKYGMILYSYPNESSSGADISQQAHVRKLLATKKPVLSSVFVSVQGHKCIAFHVPIFRQDAFVGSVAVLLPFDRIANYFVSGIKVGKAGYAFLLSEDGIELYCPVPGHTGLAIQKNCVNYPAILAMASHMLKGEEGQAVYTFGKIRDADVSRVKKYAVYIPIQLYQTFWSICVATPEAEALDFIEGFRSRWFFALLLLIMSFGYCIFWIIRAYYSIQKKTKQLETTAGNLNTANLRLQEIDKAKSIFVESVSHELRTPMTSILGFVKLINRDFVNTIKPLILNDPLAKKKGERIIDNLQIIELEGERLTRLINDVLDSAKIESGNMQWEDQIFQIKDTIWLALSTIKGQAGPAVAINFSDDGTSPWIQADPDKIMQVLMNLLNNAVKFTHKGSVAVSLRTRSQRALEVSVTDTGIGIPAGDLEKIFEKFQQVVDAKYNENKPKGTGLGLAICKQVVEHYHGTIWAESVLGRGSRFTFTLPLYEPRGVQPRNVRTVS